MIIVIKMSVLLTAKEVLTFWSIPVGVVLRQCFMSGLANCQFRQPNNTIKNRIHQVIVKFDHLQILEIYLDQTDSLIPVQVKFNCMYIWVSIKYSNSIQVIRQYCNIISALFL